MNADEEDFHRMLAPALLDDSARRLEQAEDDEKFAAAWRTLLEKTIPLVREWGDHELLLEAWELALDAWSDSPDPRSLSASVVAGVARDLPDDSLKNAAAQAWAAFHDGRFAEAAETFGREAGQRPDHPVLAFHHALALDRAGRTEEARREHERAVRLDPESFFPPLSLGDDEVRAVIDEALAELPPAIRAAVEDDCTVEVLDFPDERLIREGANPFDFGIFLGPAHGERSSEVAESPARVVLFIRNLEMECRTREDLVEEVRVTLFHEIGHALGFDEDGVDEMGLA